MTKICCCIVANFSRIVTKGLTGMNLIPIFVQKFTKPDDYDYENKNIYW